MGFKLITVKQECYLVLKIFKETKLWILMQFAKTSLLNDNGWRQQSVRIKCNDTFLFWRSKTTQWEAIYQGCEDKAISVVNNRQETSYSTLNRTDGGHTKSIIWLHLSDYALFANINHRDKKRQLIFQNTERYTKHKVSLIASYRMSVLLTHRKCIQLR